MKALFGMVGGIFAAFGVMIWLLVSQGAERQTTIAHAVKDRAELRVEVRQLTEDQNAILARIEAKLDKVLHDRS